ncbi:unnamed protein product, partial [Allacma fusca]
FQNAMPGYDISLNDFKKAFHGR